MIRPKINPIIWENSIAAKIKKSDNRVNLPCFRIAEPQGVLPHFLLQSLTTSTRLHNSLHVTQPCSSIPLVGSQIGYWYAQF